MSRPLRIAVHDLGHDEPTLCLEDEEASTCTILATFDEGRFELVKRLALWLDTHHAEARSMGDALQ